MNEMTRTIAEMKDRVKTETWQQRIQECQQSGKGVLVWCKENGIAASTYSRYLRKIRETLLQDIIGHISCTVPCSPVPRRSPPISVPDRSLQSLLLIPSVIPVDFCLSLWYNILTFLLMMFSDFIIHESSEPFNTFR